MRERPNSHEFGYDHESDTPGWEVLNEPLQESQFERQLDLALCAVLRASQASSPAFGGEYSQRREIIQARDAQDRKPSRISAQGEHIRGGSAKTNHNPLRILMLSTPSAK